MDIVEHSDEEGTAAERLRSRKGVGGPKTPEGKARSSQNALKHGILSSNPVAGGEALEDWEVHWASLRAALQPVGAYEELCVKHMATDLWWLERIERQCVDLIDIQVGQVDPPKPVRLVRPANDHADHLKGYDWPDEASIWMLYLLTCDYDFEIPEEVRRDCVRSFQAITKQEVWKADMELPWRSVHFREIIERITQAGGKSYDDVVIEAVLHLEAVLDHQREAERKIQKARDNRDRQVARAARRHTPDSAEYNNMLRYKRSHERSLEKWREELDLAQEARRSGCRTQPADDLSPDGRVEDEVA
jgi:hypothetical protein